MPHLPHPPQPHLVSRPGSHNPVAQATRDFYPPGLSDRNLRDAAPVDRPARGA